MMRLLRYVVLAVIAVALIVLALANRDMVELHLLPASMGDFLGLGWPIRLPVFLVIFAGILIGLLLGFVWEWLRAHQSRASGNAAQKQVRKLEREAGRSQPATPKDEVLALLDRPSN